ncbi:hypothetical protein BASA50_003406 [Batrachochytrium salamandrivorans]|uniref:Charged multivesicular body protein 6 n=1 Tax=Batrachochytrium salamandrivorans TaxID=1357716 RepID=A0ABQ8FIL6_9FUNG|nr:hypothetical protein BASA60_002545 [Batrachochytrium salamandrivorans]KAH6598899.1 hypothetical protein BASA50_003406 [Batrachochytrium salamandrivorans]KAH9248967.1 hypothetical protein BASA81_013367 [Batrachochytrium salamandrivorans]KAJ1339072.1 hypothetical protein BSLG_006210 [Batrachochytrium salamandrivorans]
MGHAFSKRSRVQVSSQDKAVLELKVQRDKLKQYEKKLQTVLDRELQVAKEQLRLKNHHAARLALAKKKYQQGLLDKIDSQLITLDQLTQSIEYALVEQQVLEGLQNGTKVLNDLNKEMRLEDVEKLMDDSADAVAYQNQIGEMLSGVFSDADEADVMAELDQLILLENEETLKSLPDAPTTKLPDTVVVATDTKLVELGQESDKVKSKLKSKASPSETDSLEKLPNEPLAA